MVVVQATHTFGVNACDVLLHSAQKRTLRIFSALLSFVIGIELVTKFAIQRRSNGVLYVRFNEIWREISMGA